MKNKFIRWTSLFLIAGFMSMIFPVCNISYAIAQPDAEWRLLPIRSETEFEQGLIGGEAEQHNHGIARSLSNPDIIYLSHDIGQVWRSDDAGESWKKTLNKDMYVGAGQSIEIDPVNPDSVFLITNRSWDIEHTDEGIYHSADGGENWDYVLPVTTMNSRRYEHNLAYDPASITTNGATRWYAAIHSNNTGPDDGLYRSDDSGGTWTNVGNLPGTNKRFYGIQTHPSDGQTVFAATNLGLYVSHSMGTNLQPLGNLPAGAVCSIVVNPENGDIIYAVVQNNGLYKSTNGGTTFSLLRANTTATHVFMNPGFPDVVYFTGVSTSVASQRSVVSRDGGQTWRDIYLDPPEGLAREWKKAMGDNMTGIVPNPEDPNEAVGYTLASLWKTTNNTGWRDSSSLFTGFAANYNGSIQFDPTDPDRFVACYADVGMCFTENGGDWFTNIGVPTVWYTPHNYIPWYTQVIAGLQPGTNVIVSAVGNVFSKRLIRSNVSDWSAYSKAVNSQDYWQIYDFANNFADNPLKNYWFIGFHPNNDNMVFTENKKSSDAGVTWTNIPFLTSNNASIIGMCASQPDDLNPFFTLYAVSSARNELFRSDDEGATWYSYVQTSWAMRGLDSKPIITVHPTDPDIVYAIDANKDISKFDGISWTSLGIINAAVDPNEPLNYPKALAIDPRHPEVMYAGMSLWGSETVWRSVDSGATWQNITRNLPRLSVSGFSISPHTGEVFRGGVDGTFVLPPPYDETSALVYDKCVDPAAFVAPGTPSRITLTVPESVAAWQTFTVTVGIETPEQILNADLEVLSNNTMVIYQGYEEIDEGLHVTGTYTRPTYAAARLFLAGTGAESAVKWKTQLIKLTFQVRGQALTNFNAIKVIKATLVDKQGNTMYPVLSDVVSPVAITGDLNHDGRLDAVDLEIISQNYGKDSTSPDWATASIADVNSDLVINMDDLTLETTYILQR